MGFIFIAAGSLWLLAPLLGRIINRFRHVQAPESLDSMPVGDRLIRFQQRYTSVYRVVGGLLWIGIGLSHQRYPVVNVVLVGLMTLLSGVYLGVSLWSGYGPCKR